MYPDLPAELQTPTRTYSQSPYGGYQATESDSWRPQNALVQRQQSSSALAPVDRAPEPQEQLGPKQRAAKTITKTLDGEARYPSLDDIVSRTYCRL